MKAMILAAGRGERMRPLTDRIPKALLPVAGKPLIMWLLESLARSGISDIVINVSHLAECIERTVGEDAALGMRIAYSRELEALETAGGIAAALPMLGDEPFLTVNGDIYTDFDFARLAQATRRLSRSGAVAHLVLVDNPPHHPHGDFHLTDGWISAASGARLTYSGIGLYHPELFSSVSRGAKARLAPLLQGAIAQGKVSGEHHQGGWTDVGTPERLAELNRKLAHGPGAA